MRTSHMRWSIRVTTAATVAVQATAVAGRLSSRLCPVCEVVVFDLPTRFNPNCCRGMALNECPVLAAGPMANSEPAWHNPTFSNPAINGRNVPKSVVRVAEQMHERTAAHGRGSKGETLTWR